MLLEVVLVIQARIKLTELLKSITPLWSRCAHLHEAGQCGHLSGSWTKETVQSRSM